MYTFRVDTEFSARNDGGIELLGTIEHDTPVRRSAFIEDKVYSVADTSIKSANVADPSVLLSEVIVADKAPRPPIPLPGEPLWERLSRFQAMARAELAARLSTGAGSVMTVTSEADAVTQRSFQMVLRASDRYFVYENYGDELVVASDAFTFLEAGVPLNWHNDANAYDVNGDGVVAARDVAIVINDLNRSGSRVLPTESVVRQIVRSGRFLDVSGDGRTTAIDALRIINFINRRAAAEGEGGAATFVPAGARRAAPVMSGDTIASIDLVLRQEEFDGSAVASGDVPERRALASDDDVVDVALSELLQEE